MFSAGSLIASLANSFFKKGEFKNISKSHILAQALFNHIISGQIESGETVPVKFIFKCYCKSQFNNAPLYNK